MNCQPRTLEDLAFSMKNYTSLDPTMLALSAYLQESSLFPISSASFGIQAHNNCQGDLISLRALGILHLHPPCFNRIKKTTIKQERTSYLNRPTIFLSLFKLNAKA